MKRINENTRGSSPTKEIMMGKLWWRCSKQAFPNASISWHSPARANSTRSHGNEAGHPRNSMTLGHMKSIVDIIVEEEELNMPLLFLVADACLYVLSVPHTKPLLISYTGILSLLYLIINNAARQIKMRRSRLPSKFHSQADIGIWFLTFTPNIQSHAVHPE